MEKQAKTRKSYTSDLTDAQWELVQPLIPTWHVGRKRKTDMREVLNAIFYVLTSGCAWKNLPHDFPPEGNWLTMLQQCFFGFFRSSNAVTIKGDSRYYRDVGGGTNIWLADELSSFV